MSPDDVSLDDTSSHNMSSDDISSDDMSMGPSMALVYKNSFAHFSEKLKENPHYFLSRKTDYYTQKSTVGFRFLSR